MSKPTTTAPSLITLADAAARLSVHPQTLRRWVKDGRVRAYRAGALGHYRFDPAELNAYLERNVA